MVAPDIYHLPLVLDFKLIFDYQYTSLIPWRSCDKGDYLLLYNTLYNFDWPCILNENSVESAVYNLTAVVSQAVNPVIPVVEPKNSTFYHWFSKKRRRNLRNINLKFIMFFFSFPSHYYKLVQRCSTFEAGRPH
jgi:hypothetical protein